MHQRPNRFQWIKLLKEALRGKEYNYTEVPLSKAIFLLAVPIVFEMLMESVFALVGAGPGDPDLLTIKGLKAIQNAEVIL